MVENEEQVEVVCCFFVFFIQVVGFIFCVKVGEKKGKISFFIDDVLKSEVYYLEIIFRQIIVKVLDIKGFFYVLQIICQLLFVFIEGIVVVEIVDWSVLVMIIKDEFCFGYCGLMVDVVCFFILKENLFCIIDCMGMLKINILYLYLVDDNGWCIEIKRYFLFMEIGLWCVDCFGKFFLECCNFWQGELIVEKGFYIQEDICEIVVYVV